MYFLIIFILKYFVLSELISITYASCPSDSTSETGVICVQNQYKKTRTFESDYHFKKYQSVTKSIYVFEKIHDGLCCDKGCDNKKYKPLCGENEAGQLRTFPNECEFDKYNCNNLDEFKKLNEGECECNLCDPIEPYVSVCAKNQNGLNKTFPHYCSLFYYNCNCKNGLTYEYKYEGDCKEEKCKRFCTQQYDPQCGKNCDGDYEKFGNGCLMSVYNFENSDDFVFVNKGNCCPNVCNSKIMPVCGVCKNKIPRTFRNKCEYFKYNCEHPEDEYEMVELKNCCPQGCTKEYRPVCARNEQNEYMEFSNECTLKRYNCEKYETYAIINEGHCCPKVCNSKIMPVCATCKNYKMPRTFRNNCEYYKYNCKHPEDECNIIEWVNCCPEACTEEYRPVCARNEQNEYMEFSNECTLKRYNCEKYETYEIINEGHCCPKDCNSKIMRVCGVCKNKIPRTFRNKCEYFKYNCEHPEDEYEMVELKNCCPEVCTAEFRKVCARNEQNKYMEFSNECMLNKYNCDNLETFVKINYGKCCPKSCPKSQKKMGKDYPKDSCEYFKEKCERSEHHDK